MRKSGKIILGLLTVTALVGTAYGAWTINDKFNKTTPADDPSTVVETIDHAQIGKIIVTPTGKGIKFDGAIHPSGEGNLTRSFNIALDINSRPKGVSVEDVYNLDRYTDYADSFKPDIYVSVQVVSKTTHEVFGDDAEVFTYLQNPSKEETKIPYQDWLNADAGQYTEGDAKTKGYDGYSFTVKYYTDKEGNPINPESYATSVEQMEHIKEVLDDVAFRYTFQVGKYGDYTEDETGMVILPTETEQSALTIPMLENGKLPYGVQNINLEIKDDTLELKDGKLYVLEKEAGSTDYITKEATPVVNSGKKGLNNSRILSFTYNFKKGAEYKFEYELTKRIIMAEITYQAEGHGKVSGETTYEVGKELKINVQADENYELVPGSLLHNGEAVVNNTITVAEGTNAIKATFRGIEVAEPKVTISNCKITPDTKNVLRFGEKYLFALEAELDYKVTKVTNNGEVLTANADGKYEITLGLTNEIVVKCEYTKPVLKEATLNVTMTKDSGTYELSDAKETRYENDVVTLTIKPLETHTIKSVASTNKTKIVDNKDNTYTLTLVAGENNIAIEMDKVVENYETIATVREKISAIGTGKNDKTESLKFDAKVLGITNKNTVIIADETGYMTAYQPKSNVEVGKTYKFTGTCNHAYSSVYTINTPVVSEATREFVAIDYPLSTITGAEITGEIADLGNKVYVEFDATVKKPDSFTNLVVKDSTADIQLNGFDYGKVTLVDKDKVHTKGFILNYHSGRLVFAPTELNVVTEITGITTKASNYSEFADKAIDLTNEITVEPAHLDQRVTYEIPQDVKNVTIQGNTIKTTDNKPVTFELTIKSVANPQVTTKVTIEFKAVAEKAVATLALNELAQAKLHITEGQKDVYHEGDVIKFTVDADPTGKTTKVEAVVGNTNTSLTATENVYTYEMKADLNTINVTYVVAVSHTIEFNVNTGSGNTAFDAGELNVADFRKQGFISDDNLITSIVASGKVYDGYANQNRNKPNWERTDLGIKLGKSGGFGEIVITFSEEVTIKQINFSGFKGSSKSTDLVFTIGNVSSNPYVFKTHAFDKEVQPFEEGTVEFEKQLVTKTITIHAANSTYLKKLVLIP